MANYQTPQERVAEFRELAKELFVEAGSEKDDELGARLMDRAYACEAISKRIEAMSGLGTRA
jgi:DNA-dependent RNA polymerase auxiliary subunit epsilon